MRMTEVVKISDFSVSVMFEGDDDLLERTEGSPAFLAPEIISGGKYSGRAIDVWALGVTLYVFIFGRPPFLAASEFAIYEEIREAPLAYPHPIDPLLDDLLQGLLYKDPSQRMTLEMVKRHAWVTMSGAWPLKDPLASVASELLTTHANIHKKAYSPLAGKALLEYESDSIDDGGSEGESGAGEGEDGADADAPRGPLFPASPSAGAAASNCLGLA